MSKRSNKKAHVKRDQRRAAYDKLPIEDKNARKRPGSLNRKKR